MRRGPLVVLVILLAGLGLAFLAAAMRRPRGPRSVVLVTIDTLRADRLGAYGRSPSITPALDALAARSVVFDDVWTPSPLTVPAHATLLTGRLPPLHGLRTNHPGTKLPPREARAFATLAEAFREADRRTGAFVSASVLRADRTGLAAGFDVYDDVPPARPGSAVESERRGDRTVDAALAWVRTDDRPFFLWVHLFDPHGPYLAPPPFAPPPGHHADATGYDAEVAWTDRQIGRLLDGIAASRPGDDVILCLTADHGEGLGEHGEATHGYLLHEATLRVPLLLRSEGLAPVRVPGPNSLRDVPATLLGLAGVPVPEGMARRTLLDPPPPGGLAVYAESLYGHEAFRWAQSFAFRKGSWKLVDAGADVRSFDLSRDPTESDPARHDAANPVDPLVREGLALVHGVAASGGGGSGTAGTGLDGGAYVGGGSRLAFDPVANRSLPSPWERIGDAADLEAARARLAARDVPGALSVAEGVVRRDPQNPEAWFWLARIAEEAGSPEKAAAGFVTAFGLGRTDRPTLLKALQSFAATAEAAGEDATRRATASRAGLAFLAEARRKGVPDAAWTYVFEGTLALFAGDAEAAREAVRRAETAPAGDGPDATAAIAALRKRLEELSGR